VWDGGWDAGWKLDVNLISKPMLRGRRESFYWEGLVLPVNVFTTCFGLHIS
jgi:hypothetical protein